MSDIVFNILINNRSGTVLNMGRPAIEAMVKASGIQVQDLLFCEPEHIHAELERLAKTAEPLLIGGGDGTIRDCAQVLAKSRKPFGILPFGTMNLLATDIGITSLQKALATYATGVREETMDAGFVNGEIFLCCASIGTMPKASIFREQNRGQNSFVLMPKMFWFVFDNLDKNRKQRIAMEIDGEMHRFHTAAVVIADNRFADSQTLTESNFKRRSLKEGELAAYVATTKSRTSHLRVLTRLLLGHWLKDPDILEITAKRIQLWTRRHNELVSIDGEVVKMKTPLEFTLKPNLIHLLVPVPQSVQS